MRLDRISALVVMLVIGATCEIRGEEVGARAKADEPEKMTVLPAEMSPKHPNHLRWKLGFYGLFPLSDSSTPSVTDHYRFLWERFRHPTVLIEVTFQEDGKGAYSVSVWKGTSGQTSVWEGGQGKGRWEIEKKRDLEKSDAEFFRHMIDRWGLMEAPWDTGEGGFDGSDWYLELVSRKHYHAMYRWSPKTGNVRDFAVMLIEMGIDSVLVPIF